MSFIMSFIMSVYTDMTHTHMGFCGKWVKYVGVAEIESNNVITLRLAQSGEKA